MEAAAAVQGAAAVEEALGFGAEENKTKRKKRKKKNKRKMKMKKRKNTKQKKSKKKKKKHRRDTSSSSSSGTSSSSSSSSSSDSSDEEEVLIHRMNVATGLPGGRSATLDVRAATKASPDLETGGTSSGNVEAASVETGRRRVVCRSAACPYCTAAPCGQCGNCKFPDRKNKCIKR